MAAAVAVACSDLMQRPCTPRCPKQSWCVRACLHAWPTPRSRFAGKWLQATYGGKAVQAAAAADEVYEIFSPDWWRAKLFLQGVVQADQRLTDVFPGGLAQEVLRQPGGFFTLPYDSVLRLLTALTDGRIFHMHTTHHYYRTTHDLVPLLDGRARTKEEDRMGPGCREGVQAHLGGLYQTLTAAAPQVPNGRVKGMWAHAVPPVVGYIPRHADAAPFGTRFIIYPHCPGDSKRWGGY